MTAPQASHHKHTSLPYYTGRARINLDAITHNVATIRDRVHVRSPHTHVMAVVKSNAYGHGLIESARAAVAGGATWLGTAQASEALELRQAGITERILTWLNTPHSDFDPLLEHDIDVSVANPHAVHAVIAAAQRVSRRARVHLKVDTGMGRNGYTVEHMNEIVQPLIAADHAGHISWVGIWSHLACADEPGHEVNQQQVAAFDAAIAYAQAAGARFEVRHLANSAAALTNPHAYYDLVRVGLAMYGLSPAPEVGDSAYFGLRPAMTLEADIATLKELPAGHGVSYSHQYTTPTSTVLAVVPLGYGDGIPRHVSGTRATGGLGAPITIAGQRYRISGRVCMDQFMVDLGPETAAHAGDTAVLFGDSARGEPSADEWAEIAGTISYEIVTRLSERVPRIYTHTDATTS
ncbi:alanine racemase [Timonella sp. A28]|uniref:alanine racemase n=1 Tax=Timonella sp. A28 TaxID=3442640 RepID=UPI003EBC88C5